MSTLQIPPGPSSSPDPLPDLKQSYDERRMENPYANLHVTPELMIQLQDDLSRSRKREALWISLIFHLLFILLVVNADKLARFLPQGSTVLVSPATRDHDLTYLELPPDVQKVTKRPNTNTMSDKDRIATSKKPTLDRDELKKILDSARAGRPNPPGPPAQQPQPAQQAQAASPQGGPQAPPQQQPQQQTQSVPQQPSQNQMATLMPPAGAPKPSFGSGPMLAGDAIELAVRGAASRRGGGGGDNGDFGLNQGKGHQQLGQLEVLSDTMGVDFGPYLARVVQSVKQNWYTLIPEVARAPLMKKGKVTLEFAITKNGSVAGLRLAGSSGDVALDRAAYGGITASNPFQPLPTEFGGQYLALRFIFYYNYGPNEIH
jgi:TonB family protein